MDDLLYSMEWVLPLRSDWATPIAEVFTWLGYTPFFLIFLPIGYWLWDRSIFTRLTVLVTITAVLNGWFKDFWQDPRPGGDIQLDGRVTGEPGRPSGHAQVAVAMWLWLAYEISRPWAWLLGIVLAAGVSLSRIYLGVHDVDDVLTGTAIALITLVAFAWIVRPHTPIASQLRASPVAQLALVVALVPAIWAIWPDAAQAAGRAIHMGPSSTVTVMFLLGGWLAGAALDARLWPERGPRPRWWQQIIIAVVGVLALFAVRWLIELGGEVAGLPEMITTFAGGFILGFYMTCLAPMAFRALRLMR